MYFITCEEENIKEEEISEEDEMFYSMSNSDVF